MDSRPLHTIATFYNHLTRIMPQRLHALFFDLLIKSCLDSCDYSSMISFLPSLSSCADENEDGQIHAHSACWLMNTISLRREVALCLGISLTVCSIHMLHIGGKAPGLPSAVNGSSSQPIRHIPSLPLCCC